MGTTPAAPSAGTLRALIDTEIASGSLDFAAHTRLLSTRKRADEMRAFLLAETSSLPTSLQTQWTTIANGL